MHGIALPYQSHALTRPASRHSHSLLKQVLTVVGSGVAVLVGEVDVGAFTQQPPHVVQLTVPRTVDELVVDGVLALVFYSRLGLPWTRNEK